MMAVARLIRPTNSVPEGRLRIAQDVSPGERFERGPVPQGRLKITQDAILGTHTSKRIIRNSGQQPRTMSWVTFSRPCGTTRWHLLTQDYVLGYSQPSLRDSIWRGSSHADSEARIYLLADIAVRLVGLSVMFTKVAAWANGENLARENAQDEGGGDREQHGNDKRTL